MNTRFRCPFEMMGRQNGSIIEVELGEYGAERLSTIRNAYERLHAHPASPAICFTMPASLRAACSSNQELRDAILPYQAELLAADLELNLEPFLFKDRAEISREELRVAARREPKKAITAEAFLRLIRDISGEVPGTVLELSAWLLQALMLLRSESPENPTLVVSSGALLEKEIVVLRIEEGAAGYWQYEEYVDDPTTNKTLFGIVKSPFYPEAFGRYSKNIEIVVNRDADVRALSEETRRQIRYRANVVHAVHGVSIADPYETQQPLGVWVPEYM